MNDLPADGKYPILFLTGVSYAHSAQEQERWQLLHDRAMARLLGSLAKRKVISHPPSKVMSDYMNHNPFIGWMPSAEKK